MSDIDVNKLSIEAWPLDKLKPAENNNKTHTEESVGKLAKSMADLGQIQPVIVDQDGVIIAGHGRTEAAKRLGWAKIKVIQLPVDHATAIKMRLADNLVSNQNYDMDAIGAELTKLMDMDAIVLDDLDDMIQDTKMADLLKTDLDLIGGMDTDAFSDDIMGDVETFSAEGEEKMAAADSDDAPIRRAFGFKEFSPAQTRMVKQFMAMVMKETRKDDPREAFCAWIEEVMA